MNLQSAQRNETIEGQIVLRNSTMA